LDLVHRNEVQAGKDVYGVVIHEARRGGRKQRIGLPFDHLRIICADHKRRRVHCQGAVVAVYFIIFGRAPGNADGMGACFETAGRYAEVVGGVQGITRQEPCYCRGKTGQRRSIGNLGV